MWIKDHKRVEVVIVKAVFGENCGEVFQLFFWKSVIIMATLILSKRLKVGKYDSGVLIEFRVKHKGEFIFG